MRLKSIRLLSFRAHSDTAFELAPKVNLLYGPNGAGKTNILESIHYLCLSKSYITSQDSYVLRMGAPYFEVEGIFELEHRPEMRVRIVYVPDQGKRIHINRSPLERLSQIVGMFPVVVYSPEDYSLTAGGPDERRRFLNNVLSQARPVYLDDMLKYRRALKQRNELLAHRRHHGTGPHFRQVLESWDEELVALGSRVILARRQFISQFSDFLEQSYFRIGGTVERPSIHYVTIGKLPEDVDEAVVEQLFRERINRVRKRESELGRTLVGPHLDELVFRLDEFDVRRYASQGQHRTFGMALKLAQYIYLHERLDELPILLLDDVFGSLDPNRIKTFISLLQTDMVGQSILTSAQIGPFEGLIPFEKDEHKTIRVSGGQVMPDSAGQL